MTLPDFSDDTALVTGATAGIGRAVALRLGRTGARVVLTGLGAEAGAAAVGEIEAAGGTACFIESDLAGADGWKTLWPAARAAYGPVSIFVHCASPPRDESQTALRVTEDAWDAMLNANLRSGFFLAQAAAREMRSEGLAGRIVMMTSLHAYSPRNLPHYSAAKAGQAMVVRELARALGPDRIRVIGVAPGAIPGGGFKGDPGTLSHRIPMGRVGTPEDIAASTVALLDNDAFPYVTGDIVAVDGGIAQYNWLDRPESLD